MSQILKIFLSICLLGFFIIPVEASACSSHTTETVKKEKSCCDHSSDHQSKQACKKDCCKDKEGTDTDCSGNCGQKSCHSSFPSFWIRDTKEPPNTFLLESEKTFPLYSQPYYTSGFHSIWQPPKIA